MLYYLLAAFAVYLLTLAYFFAPSPYLAGSKFAKKNQSVAILVLGDIGRSPRMQYHASSLSKAGFKVQLIGYKGTEPHRSLLQDPNIRYQFVPELAGLTTSNSRWLFPIVGPSKVLHQFFFLFIILGYAIDPPAYMLVQNPPSVPTLVIAQLMCLLRNTKLVIDWHNLGYSILALKLGQGNFMVSAYSFCERHFGRYAYAHLTVSEGMKLFLEQRFGIQGRAVVFYDRPPAHFRSLSEADRVNFLRAVPECKGFDSGADRLIVSSTSWTADEDFQILLDALVAYDSSTDAKPRILAIITGKGPLRPFYEKLIANLSFKSVVIKCAWLSAEDYPKLLGAADIGISLHTSSSGLDLPMKVVDMFGCATPVLAVRFPSVHEIISEGSNGRTFIDADDLAQCLLGLFTKARGSKHLQNLKDGAIKESKSRWDDEWNNKLRTVFVKRE